MPKSEHQFWGKLSRKYSTSQNLSMTPLTSVDGSQRSVADLQALPGCASASVPINPSSLPSVRESPTVH